MLDVQQTVHPEVDRPTGHHRALEVESPRAPAGHDMAAGSIEIDSARLLQGRRELCIRHGNECYRLRHTRNDKLILTK